MILIILLMTITDLCYSAPHGTESTKGSLAGELWTQRPLISYFGRSNVESSSLPPLQASNSVYDDDDEIRLKPKFKFSIHKPKKTLAPWIGQPSKTTTIL